MKTIKAIFATMMVCLSMATVMTSCSDDDKDEPALPAAKSIEGTYTGDMTCSVMGSESVFENLTYTVTAVSDATVRIAIPSFGNPPMQLPQITIEDIAVTGSDGKYQLTAKSFSGTTPDGKAYSGEIKGSSETGILTVQFSLKYGAMPMAMICSFSAPKK